MSGIAIGRLEKVAFIPNKNPELSEEQHDSVDSDDLQI